jgi:hypothetical protein
MAKIIQIAIAGHANTSQTQSDWTMIALYDDGSLMSMDNRGNWHDIPLPAKTKFQEPNTPDNLGIKPYWVHLAELVISGEQVTEIAKATNSHPPVVREQVLKVFRKRNPEKYEELRLAKDYGCRAEPSMRILVENCDHFGFKKVDRELVTGMHKVLNNLVDQVKEGSDE